MIKKSFLIFIKVIKLLYEYCGDLWLFCLYSNRGLKISKKKHLEYFILIEAHRVEKGLSLPKPKPFFGRELFKNISSMIYSLQKISSIDIMEVKKAHNALNSYLDMHKKITNINNKEQILFLKSLHDLNQFIMDNTKFIKPSSALKIINQNLLSDLDFRKKLFNRSSSRRFSKTIIKKDIIERIVEVAQKAPSQCNRQTTRAHLIQNKENINNILSIQGGTAGYKEYINNLFIVSGDLSGWQGPQQRNQVYVDGALFSMMLMLGIQSEKLVSCSLNLAIKNSDEKRIKIIASIPESERLIMLVAFGEAENATKNIVASSPRKKLNEVFSSD
jgi:nitroreductase